MRPLSELPASLDLIENPTAGDYIEAARASLNRRDLPRAMEQASGALALAPLEDSVLRLVDQVLSKSRAPLRLLEGGAQGTFFGMVAARAWHLAHKDLDAALRCLVPVLAFRPQTPFLGWVPRWLSRPGAASRIRPKTAAAVMRAVQHSLEPGAIDSGMRTNVEEALALGNAVASVHPLEATLCAARASLLSQLGRTADALAVLATQRDSLETLGVRSSILRQQGDHAGQLAALESALQLGGDDAALETDRAQCLVALGRLDAAETAYLRASELGSGESARAAFIYLRELSLSEAAARADLRSMTSPLARRLQRDLDCYETLLPDPSDPLVRVVRSSLQRLERSSREPAAATVVKVRTERPASRALLDVFRKAARALDARLELVVESATSIDSDDGAQVDCFLEGASSPAPDTVAAVLRLVHTPFSWNAWARLVERELPRPSSELLRVLGQPPPAPPHADVVQWLTHVHAAAGFLLGASDDDEAVEGLLASDDEWLVVVALIGLVLRRRRGARVSEECSRRVERLFHVANGSEAFYRCLIHLGPELLPAHADRCRTERAQAVLTDAVFSKSGAFAG